MKTILIPTDFSKHSLNAVMYAAGLADKMNTKLKLLHTYQIPAAYTEIPAAAQTIVETELETEKEMKRVIAQVKSATGYTEEIDYINQEGLLIDTLRDLVKQDDIDLIVMGTQGARGLEKVLLGSFTADVVEKVDCPVLVIPESATFHVPHRIMYATDFQFNDFSCLNQVSEIAQAFDAEIIVSHISADLTKQQEEEDLMDWFMEIAETNISYPKLLYKTYTGENVLEKLNKAIDELGVEILCMSTVKRTFLERIFKSSLTKEMVYQTHHPLLVFHIQEPNRI